MKIYFLISSLAIGGTENYLIKLSNFLIKKNFQVSILILSKNIENSQLKKISKKVKILKYTGQINNFISIKRFLREKLDDDKCIIYGLLDLGNLSLLLIPQNPKFIKISSRRYASNRLRFRILRRSFLTLAIAKSQRLIVNSNSIKVSSFLTRFTPKIVIPNGVEIPKLIKGSAMQDRKLNVLLVSNLRKEKGIFFLLKGLARLDAVQREYFRVIIVGEGPQRKRLLKFINKSKIDVSLEGYKDDIEPYYNWANLLIQPSTTEGFSNAILEGMSFGLAVFATDVGSAREALGKSEVLFAPKNSNSARELLLRIYQNEFDLEKLGIENRIRAKNLFTMEFWFNKHLEEFEKLKIGNFSNV